MPEDLEARILGLVLKIARRREVQFEDDGGRPRPNQDQLAHSMGLSSSMVSRILTGGLSQRTPSERPRGPYWPSKKLLQALKAWMGVKSEADVLKRILTSTPAVFFAKKGTGGPRTR